MHWPLWAADREGDEHAGGGSGVLVGPPPRKGRTYAGLGRGRNAVSVRALDSPQGASGCSGSGRAVPCVYQFLNMVCLLWTERVILAPKPLVSGGRSVGLAANGCPAIVPAAGGTGLRS